MALLKTKQILPSGHPMEVEIRGCSIEAVEKIVQKLKEQEEVSMNAIQVDNFLWGFRREKVDEMEAFPFHRVRSIYY